MKEAFMELWDQAWLLMADTAGEPLFKLIKTGQVDDLRGRLDHGRGANYKMNGGFPLLFSSIDWKQPAVTVLLLERGAHVNVGKDKPNAPLRKALERYNEGLIKLLFTYGAEFGFFEDYYHDHHHSEHFDWIKMIKDECYQIHELIQEGDTAFNDGEYEKAKANFSQAAAALEILAQSEERALQRDDSINHTDQAYVEHFHRRANYCVQKVSSCERYLNDDTTPLISNHLKVN